MWTHLLLTYLYFQYSEPAEKPQNFIAERLDWFPYRITNWFIILFFIDWAFFILLAEKNLRRIKPILEVDKESGFDKYDAFHRLDGKWLKRPYIFMFAFTFPIRCGGAFLSLYILACHCFIMSIGFKHG